MTVRSPLLALALRSVGRGDHVQPTPPPLFAGARMHEAPLIDGSRTVIVGAPPGDRLAPALPAPPAVRPDSITADTTHRVVEPRATAPPTLDPQPAPAPSRGSPDEPDGARPSPVPSDLAALVEEILARHPAPSTAMPRGAVEPRAGGPREARVAPSAVAAPAPARGRTPGAIEPTRRGGPPVDRAPGDPRRAVAAVRRPTVQVSIGRLEVRAVRQGASTTPQPRPARPAPMTLSEYLARRSGAAE
jgi:hypothetical protein